MVTGALDLESAVYGLLSLVYASYPYLCELRDLCEKGRLQVRRTHHQFVIRSGLSVVEKQKPDLSLAPPAQCDDSRSYV